VRHFLFQFRDLSSVQLGFVVGFAVVRSSLALLLQFLKVKFINLNLYYWYKKNQDIT
jgi:hypothetical protein